MGVRLPAIPTPLASLRLARHGAMGEVFGGVALAALCLPLNIGYAEAAGLPATVGIYATLLPLVAYAATAGSRHLMIGPDATIAALLAAVFPSVVASSGAAPTELAMATAILTGAVLVVLWALRLGDLVRFLSKSVLVGFIAGLALEVLLSQIRKMMAVDVDAEGWFAEVWELVRAVPDASLASVLVGVSTIVGLRMLKRWAPKVPGALVILAVTTVIVALTDPAGVSTLGDVPSGLPRLGAPDVPASAWLDLAPVAVSIAMLTIAEGLLLAKRSARTHGEPFSANGELLALGVANVAGGITGAMPSGASASRTAAMEAAGTRSQLPSLVAAATVVLVVVWFTDAVAMLPNAALAGLVANAVVGTIEAGELHHLWRVRRSEFAIALGCLLGVLVLGPIAAIVLAVLASAVDMMRRAAALPWMRLSRPDDPTTGRYRTTPDASTPDGMLVLRPGGPLFFATADGLREVLEQAAQEPGVEWVVVDLEQVSDLDPTAADAFADGIDTIVAAGRTVAVTRATEPLRAVLDRHGLTARIGTSHCFASTRAAAQAFAARPGPGDRSG